MTFQGGFHGYDELLFAVDSSAAAEVPRTSLETLELQERAHLQEWILANPQVLGPGVVVVASEYDRWQTASGDRVADRLDILGLDIDGRLVVTELKRGPAPPTIHMQAINYAAMVSRLKPEDIADMYAARETACGRELDPAAALDWLTTERLLSAETVRNPRIVLVASDFPPTVTAAVVWLNERGVDIGLIRFRAYQLDDRVVVSFSRLFPVPDVEEFTIGRRRDETAPAAAADGSPWDEPGLRRLADQANPATLALLDLCATPNGATVGTQEIAARAGISLGSVRGQLAGLTMRLRNPSYGFRQKAWPVKVEWSPGGTSSYTMDEHLADLWRRVRPSADAGGHPNSVVP